MFTMQAGRSKSKKEKKENVERALTEEQIAGTSDYLISRLNQTDIRCSICHPTSRRFEKQLPYISSL